VIESAERRDDNNSRLPADHGRRKTSDRKLFRRDSSFVRISQASAPQYAEGSAETPNVLGNCFAAAFPECAANKIHERIGAGSGFQRLTARGTYSSHASAPIGVRKPERGQAQGSIGLAGRRWRHRQGTDCPRG